MRNIGVEAALINVIVAVHNRREITCGFVKCLKSQTDKNFRLILIDDGSTDGTSKAVQDLMPSAHVLKGDGNLWWAGSLQLGIEHIRKHSPSPEDLILICNDDVTFDTDFLARGRSLMVNSKKTIYGAQFFDQKKSPLLILASLFIGIL